MFYFLSERPIGVHLQFGWYTVIAMDCLNIYMHTGLIFENMSSIDQTVQGQEYEPNSLMFRAST